MVDMKNEDGSFEMSIRVLGNEFIGFRIAADDFKTKWIVLGLITVASIAGILATFGPAIKELFTTGC
jgi:hypothetical protein